MNNRENKGYYVYSSIAIIGFLVIIAFVFYLVYDLLVKLSMDQFTNSTVLQSIIALIITVFLGGYFSKAVEHKKHIKLENYKSQKDIALRIIDLASMVLNDKEGLQAKGLLISESYKVKLLFDDKLLLKINDFVNDCNSYTYNGLMDDLKRFF
ncbi:hypothetical protein EDC19_0437 [Natranaerovirga hydrolytica]|uniref:Uncharacterized protein n=1 Tax=Natranaerovirga hydrolytica TaxID=680378 RepID=A0A4R1MXU3_9FIRM|nr:hypothetical protein [Natranaerovirga hydrolytica]TCK98026.1 hypothetical protein EDC19_0437 [Natranaerovirga hydrolytica]